MNNIKRLRINKELTQIAIQMKLGISQSLQSKYENNECLPTAENLIILSDFYKVSIDYLLNLTDIPDQPPRKP